jgi:hypothetical protein
MPEREGLRPVAGERCRAGGCWQREVPGRCRDCCPVAAGAGGAGRWHGDRGSAADVVSGEDCRISLDHFA